MMHRRTSLPLATALLAAAVLAGCTPTPEPTPTPTALFASEDEAYAAAEATFTAYLEADNAERRGDEGADPEQYVTGKYADLERQLKAHLEQTDTQLVGDRRATNFQGSSAGIDGTVPSAVATVCLDASDIRLLDAAGEDVTVENRQPILTVEVSFAWNGELLAISSIDDSELDVCS